jgi:hypothetical protein
MADRAGISPDIEINDLAWKPNCGPSTEFHSLFPGLETRRTGDPPEIKTAAPREIGSGGEADLEIGEISETEFTYLGLSSATPPRIIALHFFGVEVGEVRP